MTNDDDSPADGPARFGGGRVSRVRAAAGRGERPWWKWLVIGLLLTFSIVVTALFVAAMTGALVQHHWAQAMDTSRDAVPAAVGWGALLIVLFAGGHSTSGLLSDDSQAVSEKLRRAARDEDSVRRAGQRVQKLTDRLAVLTAEHGPGRHAARHVPVTTARLDQARQWLESAQAAHAVSQAEAAAARDELAQDDIPDPAPRHGPTAGRVA